MTRQDRIPRPQTAGEEIANSVTHGLGFLASLAAAPVLIGSALARHSVWAVAGAAVFAASMIVLYGASTLYHSLPPNRAKQACRVVDHIAIYLLIAGTYTPFTLGVLRGTWGWTLFGLVWGLAAFGLVFKSLGGTRRPILSILLYIVMGWLIVIAARPLVTRLPLPGLFWLAAGGLLYTGGIGFYAARQRPFFHAIWHLFVLGGTACHFFAVLWYAQG